VEVLGLTAAAALFIFYYFARPDTIAVSGPLGGWTAMTGGTLSVHAHFLAAAVVLGVLPAAAARRVTRLSLADLGLGLGDWRRGLALLAAGIPLAVAAGAIGAGSPEMRAVYPLDASAARSAFPAYAVMQFLYFGAWEALFRGVLLFGLTPRLGAGPANMVQTALSVTAHFGRAATETLAALPAGLVFGFVCLRLRSIWYIAIIHWAVGVSLDWFILRP
jgi:membrane protease YdiL (CAAX protease family)